MESPTPLGLRPRPTPFSTPPLSAPPSRRLPQPSQLQPWLHLKHYSRKGILQVENANYGFYINPKTLLIFKEYYNTLGDRVLGGRVVKNNTWQV